MINLGKRGVVQENDGWTIRTKDGKVSMHYEHTVAIGKDKADVLSSFEAIEAAVEKNANLYRLEQVIEY
jgi:methionyl aminopeptidase